MSRFPDISRSADGGAPAPGAQPVRAAESVAAGETPPALLIATMLLVIIPVITISQLAAHWRVDVVDDQLFGAFGWRMAHGARLYLDVWDNKPPGIYWINALGMLLGRDSYVGVVVLCALAIAVALAAFFVISASLYFRGAAALATVLASFYITHGFYEAGSNRAETFLIAFELVAVALYVRGFVRDRWWIWLLAGACCGCALLFKQVGLAAWGAMGLHMIALVLLRKLRWQVGLRRCVLLAAGPVCVVALAAAALAAQGALHEAWYAVVEFNRAYFAAGASSFRNTFFNRYMIQQHMIPILLLPLLMTAASLIHASLWALRPALRPADVQERLRRRAPVCPHAMPLLFVWFAAAFYGAIVSPHYFEHYLVPTLPPLLLMSGYLINVLRTEITLTQRLQQRIWVTACFVAMAYFAYEAYRRHVEVLSQVWVYRFERGRQAEWEAVGDQVARLTKPEDRIQCFGYLPGVYLHARRANATRYATTEKIGQLYERPEAERIRQEMIRRLSAEPPVALVMSSNDYFTISSPPRPERPRDSLGDWMAAWVPEHYVVAVDVREFNVLILLRRDRAPPDTEPVQVGSEAEGT